MSAFDNLPIEKRERIINAAMYVFSVHGYQKASVADIARAAGISKAMIFCYFGSKIGCYKFICEEVLRISLFEFEKFKEQILAVSGFFERVILSVQIKMDILKQRPSLLEFGASMYYERSAEVEDIIKNIIEKAYKVREIFLSSGIDESKFKDRSEAKKIAKMVDWISKGCAEEWSKCDRNALDGLFSDFIDSMVMLKKHFYKEEYI